MFLFMEVTILYLVMKGVEWQNFEPSHPVG